MRVLVCLLLTSAASSLHAQGGVTLGIVTGNDYMKLSEAERGAWVVGVLDGMMAEASMSSKDPNGSWIGRCIRDIPVSQLQAMVDRHIRKAPDAWHAPAALVVRAQFEYFCKVRG